MVAVVPDSPRLERADGPTGHGVDPAEPLSRPTGWTPTERDLLARHHPILAFDRRELFFPISVDRYLEGCELWEGRRRVLVAPAAIDLDDRWTPKAHLRFVNTGDRLAVFGRDVERTARRILSRQPGLVGLVRFVIEAVCIALVALRPTTPKATAVAAARKADLLETHRVPACHARTLRTDDWLVLHYAWLYAMNDWRTGYGGMNDHEGDWEQAWVFCDPTDLSPRYIAASNHQGKGRDLVRDWHDPSLVREGARPVLFAAAGSHALFFAPGHYVSRLEVRGLRWLARLLAPIGRIMERWGPASAAAPTSGLPFVDHATGDGTWLGDATLKPMAGLAWCEEFRGLWGVDTGDPLQAERGPGGPKFNRKGKPRRSWSDPAGHVGLDPIAAPSSPALTRPKVDAGAG